MCVLRHSVVSDSLRPYGQQPARLLCPWGFSRQESWSGLPCPLLGDLPNSGKEPRPPTLQADSLLSEPPGKPNIYMSVYIYICIYTHTHTHTCIYPWSRTWQPTPVFLPAESLGQRSLAGCCP